MTAFDHYTDKEKVSGRISHDDDEAYDIGEFPYVIEFEIDVSDKYDEEVPTTLIICSDTDSLFLKTIFSDQASPSGYRKVSRNRPTVLTMDQLWDRFRSMNQKMQNLRTDMQILADELAK